MMNNANPEQPIATIKIRGRRDHRMRGAVTIGRDPQAGDGATLVVGGDPLVSKSHLCVDVDQGGLVIMDLGSSNGTFLHHPAGETAVPSDRWVPIPVGAEIAFGDQRMVLEQFVPSDPPDPDITPVSPRRVSSADAATVDDSSSEAGPAAPR